MSLKDRIIEWANSGLVSPADTSKQNSGWVAGNEKPFFRYFNWWMNQSDRTQNDTADTLNERGTQSPSNPNVDAISELYHGDRDWSNLTSSLNRYTGAGAIINMCRGWNYTLDQEVVWAADRVLPAGITQIRNEKPKEDGTFGITSERFLVTLDHASDVFVGVCCDGPYVYILALTQSPLADIGKVYKMSANPWSSTPVWVRNFSVYGISTDVIGLNRIIVADDDNLAILLRGLDTSSQAPIAILSKDNTSFTTGSGNAPSSATLEPGAGLCSDGTSVFFTIEDPAYLVAGQLCAADISDPTVASGMTAHALGVTPTSRPVGGIIFDGEHVVCVPWMGNNAKVFTYRRSTDTLRETNALVGGIDSTVVRFPVVFDGMRIWSLMNYNGDSNEYNAFITSWYPYLHNALPNPGTYPEYDGVKHFLADETEDLAGPVATNPKMVYADGCMWISPLINDPVTQPLIIRMPNVLGRQ